MEIYIRIGVELREIKKKWLSRYSKNILKTRATLYNWDTSDWMGTWRLDNFTTSSSRCRTKGINQIFGIPRIAKKINKKSGIFFVTGKLGHGFF